MIYNSKETALKQNINEEDIESRRLFHEKRNDRKQNSFFLIKFILLSVILLLLIWVFLNLVYKYRCKIQK